MLKSISIRRCCSAMRGILIAVVATLFALTPATMSWAAEVDPVETRVNDLLGKMTFEEKVSLMSGTKDEMHIPGIERLKIPSLKFTDGPVGVRCWGKSTAYPCGSMLAATWDVDAAREMGVALGRDCRARGVHILLGPGVDLYRVAQCGRNFEYFGEDPYLSAQLAGAWIKGVQSQQVATSVKHYAANDQEILRDSIDTRVSERRLHEICFPPFKAAVQDANAWTVMAAYNKVNGDWCTANKYLLTDVLRNQWGFKGVLMSDWGAVHELNKPITAGNDLEMGKTIYYTGEKIKQLMQEGKLTQDQLDEHIRRILRMDVSMGFLDRDQLDTSIKLQDPMDTKVTLKVATEGLVLLKNKDGLLPLKHHSGQKIVVMGPNACPAVIGGGGSSYTEPFASVSVLDAMKHWTNEGMQVDYIPTYFAPRAEKRFDYNNNGFFEAAKTDSANVFIKRTAVGEYFDNPDFAGKPVLVKDESQINFGWGAGHPVEQITSPTYSVRWKGQIKAAQTDEYLFACQSDGATVFLDGKPLLKTLTSPHAANDKPVVVEKKVALESGQLHDIVIEYQHTGGQSEMRFGWSKATAALTEVEKKQLKDADAVVVAAGFNSCLESEGFDRPYKLPQEQIDAINEAGKLNSHVIVVLNAGGNVDMNDWIDSAAALVHAWYPGEIGNMALGEMLLGYSNPSGKLPDTFEARWEDSPAYGNYPGDSANGGSINYTEGIYCGYRWFDKKSIAPRFPFGFGLSYTTFSIDNLRVENEATRPSISVNLKNTGSLPGAEVVQLYVRPVGSKIDRPVQELKGFKRVQVKPGETQNVTFNLDKNAFGTYDEESHQWIYPPGEYDIVVGSSSRDKACTKKISWQHD